MSAEEVAAILAALHILRQDTKAVGMDPWILAARLDQEPDPWLERLDEAYSKLHP